MHKKVRWITETAAMLAMLVTLQLLTKPLGQVVTGSCVNTVLAVAALFGGMGCGLTVAICSPVLAFYMGIAGNIVVVPVIMVGNCVFVVLLSLIAGKGSKKDFKSVMRLIGAWLAAAAGKFAVMYPLVAWLICGVLSQNLLDAGVLKPPMLTALPATFGLMQLMTALIGGCIALLITPTLKKAMKK